MQIDFREREAAIRLVELLISKELVAVFESAAEASRKTGISDIQIRKVCQGKGITAGGYYWNYRKAGDA